MPQPLIRFCPRRTAWIATPLALAAVLSLGFAAAPQPHGGGWGRQRDIRVFVPAGGPTNPAGPVVPTPGYGTSGPTNNPGSTPGSKTTSPSSSGGQLLAGIDVSLPADSWDHWWYANRARFLDLQARRRALATATADVENEEAAAIDGGSRAEIGALVHRVLSENSGASADEQSAALITAAKLAWQPAETRKIFMRHLRSPVQEVRETAALCLGVLGDVGALPLLIALLKDGELARSVCGANSIDDRTRAFAAYGMGVLVRRIDPERQDAAAKLVRESLLAVLDGSLATRPEVEAAAVCSLGVLPHSEREWLHVAPLLEKIWTDPTRNQLVRAQVPTAAARLGGSSVSERLALLVADENAHGDLRNSAELASGALLAELQPLNKKRLSSALEVARERGGFPGERAFATLSLARLHDPAALRALTREAASGAHLDRPWIALGLGLAAREGAKVGADVSELKTALRDGYRSAKAAEVRSAFAIALGLAGDEVSAAMLRRDLKASSVSRERGHLAVALGLLNDLESQAVLRELYLRATREPEEAAEIAIGLMLLGDQQVVPHLLGLLQTARTTATLAAVAMDLGLVGGDTATHALIELAEDAKRTALVRAYAIVGLGYCVEEQPLPWSAPFSADFNYLAAPDTLAGPTGMLAIL